MKNRLNLGIIFGLILLVLTSGIYTAAQPTGASIIFNETVTIDPAAATAITTAGGSFTTLVLNVTQQNPRWKAYVGNVTGQLVLADNNNVNIYDWNLATITGEVYASRNNSISWSNIQCATNALIQSEEIALNITTANVDSINLTFANTIHQSFWIGSTQITNSSCRAIATYVNATAQAATENADFQEILLDDTSNLVYATILEQDAQGYDLSKTFDFQLIVAEDEFKQSPTPYYFYAEIG